MNGDKANNFEFFLASGGGNLNFITNLPIQKGATDRRSSGDKALFDIGFFTADELVFHLNIALHVKHKNAGTVAGAVFRDIGEIEHAEIAHALFEVADFGVDVALALFGVLVLGVLGKVAVRAGNGNFLREFDVEFVLERVDFLLKFLLNLCKRVSHSLATCIEKNDAESGQAELRHGDIIRGIEMEGQGEVKGVRLKIFNWLIISVLRR